MKKSQLNNIYAELYERGLNSIYFYQNIYERPSTFLKAFDEKKGAALLATLEARERVESFLLSCRCSDYRFDLEKKLNQIDNALKDGWGLRFIQRRQKK